MGGKFEGIEDYFLYFIVIIMYFIVIDLRGWVLLGIKNRCLVFLSIKLCYIIIDRKEFIRENRAEKEGRLNIHLFRCLYG